MDMRWKDSQGWPSFKPPYPPKVWRLISRTPGRHRTGSAPAAATEASADAGLPAIQPHFESPQFRQV